MNDSAADQSEDLSSLGEASEFMEWGGGIFRKSLYLSRMTLFAQTILYVSLYFS